VHDQGFPAKKHRLRGNAAGSRLGQSTTVMPSARALASLDLHFGILERSRVHRFAPTESAIWLETGHARLCRLPPVA
jgi:hypothetical protein